MKHTMVKVVIFFIFFDLNYYFSGIYIDIAFLMFDIT